MGPQKCRQDTHSQHTSVHKRGTHITRLAQELHNIFVRLKRVCHLVLHMSHHRLFSHLPFTTSTSSSSFILPSTTTPEYAAQSVQTWSTPRTPSTSRTSPSSPSRQAAPSRITSPRTTTPTGYEPKELATVSRIEDYPGDPYQFFDVQENLEKKVHRAPNIEEVKEFAEIGTASLLDSKISETSYFQSKMHFDDSVESIADSDLEDGEFQKMLTSPTVCPESFGETRCNGRARERGKCTICSR